MSNGMYWDDFEIGQKWSTQRRTITETDLVNFMCNFGIFEPLYMDVEYVMTQTPYKRRLVPGALTYAMAEGLTIQMGLLHGTAVAFLSARLDVKAPVAVGDTIQVQFEITEKRATRKPEQGLVRALNRVMNQDGLCVLEYDPLRLVRTRQSV